MLTLDLLASKVKSASLFVWAIYIYIESIEVTFTQVSESWPVGLVFFCNCSLYPEHRIMQEPVYVLHLITCHGRIMPRLAELLLTYFTGQNSHVY